MSIIQLQHRRSSVFVTVCHHVSTVQCSRLRNLDTDEEACSGERQKQNSGHRGGRASTLERRESVVPQLDDEKLLFFDKLGWTGTFLKPMAHGMGVPSSWPF